MRLLKINYSHLDILKLLLGSVNDPHTEGVWEASIDFQQLRVTKPKPSHYAITLKDEVNI